LGSYEVLKSGENSGDHTPAVDSNGRWQWGWPWGIKYLLKW